MKLLLLCLLPLILEFVPGLADALETSDREPHSSGLGAPETTANTAPEKPISKTDLPAYQLNLAVDLPLLATGGLVMVAWVIELEPARCAPLCDPEDLNPVDKPVAGFYNKTWSLSSDISLGVLGIGIITTLFVDEGWKNGLNDLVVMLESFAAANSLAIIISSATRRPRPLVYGEKAPVGERLTYFSSLSFFSGHTAGAFALSLSLFNTIWRRKPGSPLSWVVLGVGIALSGAIATGRVMGGKHFPTDVLVGAGVGTAMGFAIPAMHKPPSQKNKLVVVFNGLGITGKW